MNASKIISNAFNDWQKSCQETRRGQTALLQKIKKYASKLNKREKRHFLREAENFCEKYDLLMSEPFTRLDEYLAKFEQLEWEEKQNKKQADSSKDNQIKAKKRKAVILETSSDDDNLPLEAPKKKSRILDSESDVECLTLATSSEDATESLTETSEKSTDDDKVIESSDNTELESDSD